MRSGGPFSIFVRPTSVDSDLYRSFVTLVSVIAGFFSNIRERVRERDIGLRAESSHFKTTQRNTMVYNDDVHSHSSYRR
jgi:hypothetical protein